MRAMPGGHDKGSDPETYSTAFHLIRTARCGAGEGRRPALEAQIVRNTKGFFCKVGKVGRRTRESYRRDEIIDLLLLPAVYFIVLMSVGMYVRRHVCRYVCRCGNRDAGPRLHPASATRSSSRGSPPSRPPPRHSWPPPGRTPPRPSSWCRASAWCSA